MPEDSARPSTSAPTPGGFPPYPPYAMEPAPASVADTIIAGRQVRLKSKSGPKKPVRAAPKPARPRGPKATDVKLTKRAARAYAACLRKHNAILTDRLESMSKPPRRRIIYLWREHAQSLRPEVISRLRGMLDADEPFKPDQAYEYFINLRKMKRMAKAKADLEGVKKNVMKKDVSIVCCDKRFIWARDATVAIARGIQQRLSRPGDFNLTGGSLRLSNIILDEIFKHLHMHTPTCSCNQSKIKCMIDVADKVAVWIEEILTESNDRMLMMDFDEDEEVENCYCSKTATESGAASPASNAGGKAPSEPGSAAPTPSATSAVTPAATAKATPPATATTTPAATATATPATSPTTTAATTPATTPAGSSPATPGAPTGVTPGTSKTSVSKQ